MSLTLLAAVHDDEDVLDPPLGVTGHVPLPTTDRFEFFFLSMKFLTLNFIGVFFFLIACLLPDIVVEDDEDAEDAKDGDDEVPIPVPVPKDDEDGDQLCLLPP